MNQPLYTTTEVARILGVTRQAIWERINRGTIKTANVSSVRSYFITHKEVERLKEKGS